MKERPGDRQDEGQKAMKVERMCVCARQVPLKVLHSITLSRDRVHKYSARDVCASSLLQPCRGTPETDRPLLNTSSCGMTTWGSEPWWPVWHARVTLSSSSVPHKNLLPGSRSPSGALMPHREPPVAMAATRREASDRTWREVCVASASRTGRARRSTPATG